MENDKLIAELRRRGLSNGTSLGSHSGLCDAASDCIEGLVAQLKAKEYTIMGIMNAVDKWLDGDELKADEVNRAATMRENTLQIVDRLETQLAERDKQLAAAGEALEGVAHSGGNFCEHCGSDCCDAGLDDPDTFQCGCFKWRGAQEASAKIKASPAWAEQFERRFLGGEVQHGD